MVRYNKSNKIKQPEGDSMKVAIFDFDGTIYKHETYTLMMDHVKHHPIYGTMYKTFYSSIVPPYLGYKLRVYPEAKMKFSLTQKYLNIFAGKTIDEVEEYFGEIAEKMTGDFNPLVIERMKQHKQNGDYIMVVSGAYQPLLEMALAGLPVDKIIGTEIPVQDNYINPETSIDHVQAERKSELILESLQDKTIDWDCSYAYGDSTADLPVLEMVGHPVAVCPDVALQDIVNKKDWTIVC